MFIKKSEGIIGRTIISYYDLIITVSGGDNGWKKLFEVLSAVPVQYDDANFR